VSDSVVFFGPFSSGPSRTADRITLRSALLLLRDDCGRYLMQLRSSDAPIMPSTLGFFGGGVRISESPGSAASREFDEEIKYAGSVDFKHVGRRICFISPEHIELADFFFSSIRSDRIIGINEGEAYQWISMSESKPNSLQQRDWQILQTMESYMGAY